MSGFSRRRFIQVGAVFFGGTLISRSSPPRHHWRGIALGGDAEITLFGDKSHVGEVLEGVQRLIDTNERRFSLYRPDSALSQLNRDGMLAQPDDEFLKLLAKAKAIHAASLGAFDPTVQSEWKAHAFGLKATPVVGLEYVAIAKRICFSKPNMQMSLNGIAQGHLTDLVHDYLLQNGFERILVNVGEYRAAKGRWAIAIENQRGEKLGVHGLSGGAISTSSADALLIGQGVSHILHPMRNPKWRTVAVAALDATTADGFSTAFILMEESEIRSVLSARGDIQKVWLEDFSGRRRAL